MAPDTEVAAWRDRSSSLPEIVGSAREELEAGNFENAWTAYQIALEHWLRLKLLSTTGKSLPPSSDRYQILDKLKTTMVLDDWSNKAIRVVLTRPMPVDRWHAEIAAAVVTPLAVDQVDSTPQLPADLKRPR